MSARPAAGRGTILLLAAVAALGSLATQLLVPALPQLAHDLHTNAADAQLVIGFFLVGLGTGQLLTGPLADRLGRKRVLLAGLALYCLGSLAAAMAPTLPLLLAARVLQALGGATGVVVARVLVGDLFPPEETAARQATLMAVVLVSPALAPVIGGALSEIAGWRAIFGGLAGAGLAGMALAAASLPQGRTAPSRHGGPGLAETVRALFANPRFVGPVLAIAGGSSALYMFLGNAPFLLTHAYGLSAPQVGAAMMLIAAASIASTFLVARIERGGDALLTGAALGLSGGLLLLGGALAGLTGLAAFIGPMTLLGLGAGMIGPAGITRVIRALPGREGTSASLAGATQMLGSALAAFVLSRFAPVDLVRLGLGVALACAISLGGTLLSRNAAKPRVQGLA